MTCEEALALARGLGVARLDAQLILGHVLGRSRAWVIAHDQDALDPAIYAPLQQLLKCRADGVPVAYLLGEREFHGLMLQVTPAVLVPRPETELLADWALERLRDAPAASAVDLGTGSGALALAVQQARPDVAVCASDVSSAALDIARANAARHGLSVEFVIGHWWRAVAGRRFGLALSNPPYIAADDVHLRELRHEPRSALTPGGDGLAALREIIQQAPAHLEPGAWLLLEHGHDQARAVQQMLQQAGFDTPQTRLDLARLPRCTGACFRGQRSGLQENPAGGNPLPLAAY